MRKISYTIIFIIIGLIAIYWLSCDVDHGLAPLPGKLRATVHFRNEPPADTEGIYLTVAPVFPPQAINMMYQSPNSLPIDQDSVVHEIDLPYGHYEAVSLWWYSKNTESNLADILAIPLDPYNGLLPLQFDITKENPVFEINLYANWNKMKRDASIEGTIHFNREFPRNTYVTAIAAFSLIPQSSLEYLTQMRAIDFSIGPESRNWNNKDKTFQYKLPVRHGTVQLLALFWLPEHADLTDIEMISVYADSVTYLPVYMSLKEGQIITGADLFVNWTSVQNAEFEDENE